jgi:hypothetical protein
MSSPAPEPYFNTAQGQPFAPGGVQNFVNSAPLNQNPNAVSPHAIRWLFNPFSFINVSERPPSGHLYLEAGVFIPIVSQQQFVSTGGIPSSSPGKAFMWHPDSTPQEVGVAAPDIAKPGYRTEIRSAFAIATELEEAYADRGVKILNSLTKFDGLAAVTALHRTLVRDGLSYARDPYQPEHPIPNLLVFESYLAKEAKKAAAKIDSKDLAIDPSELVTELLGAVRQAIQLCRTVTRDAKRVVANKTQGYVHSFDAWHARCFIALGEAVPSDLPFAADAQRLPDTSELNRLRAENEALRREKETRELEELRAENERLRAPKEGWEQHAKATGQPASGTAETSAEKIAVQCSFIKKDDTQCKGRGNPETGRCPSHPLEQGENTDGREENE